MAFFASDNTSNVCQEVMEALGRANPGHAKAYGEDKYSFRLTEEFRRLFDHEQLLAFPVFNGSAANSAALACLVKPYESVVGHHYSHISRDECGMPEFFTGGKVVCVSGDFGKIDPLELVKVLRLARHAGVHHSRPRAVSITQSTEVGTLYRTDEILQIAGVAKEHDLYLHMDGARFANAVSGLQCKAADVTWKCGVDVLSFGGTKNGAMLAEAIIFFNPKLADDFGYIRKRAGQLASKQRYVSAQLLALIESGLWLRNATAANSAARKLTDSLRLIPQVKVCFPVEANVVFVEMPKALADGLLRNGHEFYHWPLLGDNVYRLVSSFNTTESEVESFIGDCKALGSNPTDRRLP